MAKEQKAFLDILSGVLKVYGFSPLIAWALRFFLRNPYESLVITDSDGRLQFVDRGSEKFFGLAEGEAKGVNVKDVVPDSYLPTILEKGVPSIGRVFDVRGIPRIGSAFPLVRDGETIGAVGRVVFRSLEEVERINRKIHRLKREVESLREMQREGHRAVYTFDHVMGISQDMRDAIELAGKIAVINSDVLIAGESGTGKELFAQAIHNSVNPDAPFVRVNSPAIPFELAESELFGYEKGAFSGASTSGKPGKFELANDGTLFLDEISALPLSIQAKLLNVLQEREVERLGATRVQKLKFRLIAATNVDLKALVKEGRFREDLYYRVAKASVNIPPLRERKEDILVYANHYLKAINERFGTKFKRLSQEAILSFMQYDWPGNVRELINVLEQAALKEWEGDEIRLSALPHELTGSISLIHDRRHARGFKVEVRERERELLLKTLEETGGNKRKAAAILGMARSTFYKKLNGSAPHNGTGASHPARQP